MRLAGRMERRQATPVAEDAVEFSRRDACASAYAMHVRECISKVPPSGACTGRCIFAKNKKEY